MNSLSTQRETAMSHNVSWEYMLLVNHRSTNTDEERAVIIAQMNELYEPLPTEALHELFWEAYKSVEGIRPRWMNPNDRDGMLCWFCIELYPSQQALRKQEYDEEDEWLKRQEEKLKLEEQECAEHEKVMAELKAAYDVRFDYLDPSLKPVTRKQRPFNLHWWN